MTKKAFVVISNRVWTIEFTQLSDHCWQCECPETGDVTIGSTQGEVKYDMDKALGSLIDCQGCSVWSTPYHNDRTLCVRCGSDKHNA